MKPIRQILAGSTGLFLCAQVQASYQPALPANPITVWTAYVDTGSAAPVKHSGSGVATSFTAFTPPVISGDSSMFGGATEIAFKGTMATGTVTTANNEGIWSNVDPSGGVIPGSTLWMVAQEGDTVLGPRTIGNGGRMLVRALQTTGSFGGTLFNTNSNLDPSPNFSVYEGGTLNGLAGANLPGFVSGSLAVTDGPRIAVWSKDGFGSDGTRAWTIAPTFPHTLTPAAAPTIHWTSPSSNPRVQCSPAISFYGGVAHRGRSTPLSIYPPDQRDFIEAVPLDPNGLFPARAMVVRAGDPAPPTGEIFGTFHPVLMAITGGPNVPPTVAWQMSTMRAGENSGSTLGHSIPYGATMPNSTSLWCWREDPILFLPSYAQIARAGQDAPEITGRKFKSFYALYLVDDNASWPDTDVFYGVILDNGKHAIYTRQITMVAGTTLLGLEQLIATDSPGGPASMDVPAIHGGTAYPIASLYPWFSVDLWGNVLMKATLGGAVPTNQRQCLINAMSGADAHALRMRAQSGPTTVATPSYGTKNITNFAIIAHEQGPLGRGQGIYQNSIGTLITFPGGTGVFTGY